MAALTRSDVKDTAFALLNAKDAANNPHFAPVANDLADQANRDVYEHLIRANPMWFATERTSITWPSGSERIDMTSASYLGAEPRKITVIYETPGSGVPSQSNRVVSIWAPGDGRHRYRQQSYWWSIYATGSMLGKQRYSHVGNYLYATPIPASGRYIHIEWVPQIGTMTGDSTEVLNGQAEQFGHAVGVRLAFLLNVRDNNNRSIETLWGEEMTNIKRWGREMLAGGPRMVGGRR